MKQHFIFMNGGLNKNFTGIEGAAFKRYKLFTKYLNIQPIYLCMYYDLDLNDHLTHLKASGKIPDDFKYVNLYEFFLRDCDIKRQIKPVQGLTHNTRILKNNDKKRVARVYNLETGLLTFVNFYDEDGNRYRMDKYDEDGCLSISIFFVLDGRTVRQSAHYYRQDGSLALSWQYAEKDGLNKVKHIIVFDKDGTPSESFTNEDQLYTYLLHYYLNSFSHQDQINLFIDRHVRFADKLTDGSIAAKINCLHMMHNIHLENPMDKSSKLSSAYNYLKDLEHFDGVVTLTPQQTQDIKERFGDFGNVHCIPHSIDIFPQPVAHKQRKKNRCVAVGRLHPQKQHDKMLRIFAKVVQQIPDAQLDIYGRGELEAKLKQQIKDLGLENNVQLKGFTANIGAEFETAQCSLLSSKYEGQPLVILESLSYGCPVISSDICYGPASMIDDGNNGFLLPADDEELFAQRIIQTLQDEEFAAKLSANAYESAKRFSQENIAPLWSKLIDKLQG